eukprot:3520599-Pyramimonas_sp.AAC.1
MATAAIRKGVRCTSIAVRESSVAHASITTALAKCTENGCIDAGRILSQNVGASSRLEAQQLAYRSGWEPEAGRFRPGTGVWEPRSTIDQSGVPAV